MKKLMIKISEVAKEFGVCEDTIRDWTDTGKLKCYRTAGGHRRFKRADVEALLNADTPSERKTFPQYK